MDQTPAGPATPGPAPSGSDAGCAERREDLALLAAGQLSAAEAQALEAHVKTCAVCRERLGGERAAWAALRAGSGPDQPLDAARVLAELRRRMAVESREIVVTPQAPLSRRGSLLGLALFVALAAALILVAVFSGPAGPGPAPKKPDTPDKPAVLAYQERGQPAEAIPAGAELHAGAGGLFLRFSSDATAYLREGARARVISKHEMILEEGQAAVYAPAGSGFVLRGRHARAQPGSLPGARFALDVNRGDGGEHLAVAEGRVEFSGASGTPVTLEAGQGSSLSVVQAPEPARAMDTAREFAWVTERFTKAFACELRLASGGPRPLVTLCLRNTSKEVQDTVAWQPLGISYQLEIRRPGAASAEFSKFAPSAQRRVTAAGAETLGAGTLHLTLGPGEALELDIPLAPFLAAPGAHTCAAHFLYYVADPDSIARGWGFTLRSAELRVEREEPAKKGP